MLPSLFKSTVPTRPVYGWPDCAVKIALTDQFLASAAAAPVRVGGRFRFHRKTPVAIENRACLAEYDRGRRSLTLTVSTQIPGIIRDLLVDLLRVPGHSVRVVAPDVGGGFGGKASIYQEEIVVSVLALGFATVTGIAWTAWVMAVLTVVVGATLLLGQRQPMKTA